MSNQHSKEESDCMIDVDVSLLPMSMRSAADELAYRQAKINNDLTSLSEEKALQDFTYWRIIDNRFPYSMVLKTSHILLPKRVFANRLHMTKEERHELTMILLVVSADYDFVMENFAAKRSIKNHFHMHLGCYYDNRGDIKQ